MKLMAPHFPPANQPRFGYTAAPFALKILDFHTLGASTVAQNKLIYAAVIASRLWKSRSWNEVRENASRDVLGWYSWFMGSPLMQTALVCGLVSPKIRDLMVTRLNQDAPIIKKLGWTFLNPSKLWLITSDVQLHQRKEQMIRAIQRHPGLQKNGVGQKMISQIEKRFNKAIFNRSLVSFAGLMFTFLMLGVGINLINIALTKSALRKKQHSNPQNSFPPSFSGYSKQPYYG